MSDIEIKFDGSTYKLDDFELGDLEELEAFLGGSLNDKAVMNSMKAAVGFVWLIKRQGNPEFTVEDARKVKLAALEAADDEEPAAAKRPPIKRAARR